MYFLLELFANSCCYGACSAAAVESSYRFVQGAAAETEENEFQKLRMRHCSKLLPSCRHVAIHKSRPAPY